MSKAPGFSLQHTWKDCGVDEYQISQAQKAKVVHQLGVLTAHLSRLRFDRAGSLFEEDGEYHIKSCLGRGLLLNQRYTLGELSRGPFGSDMEYHKAQLSAFIEHVKYLPLGYHCFLAPVPGRNEYGSEEEYLRATDWWNDFVTIQSKIDGSANRVDYVVAAEILAEVVRCQVDRLSTVLSAAGGRPFAIHHPDLSVNNIYVDKDYNITCIIDWAFCSAVPLPILLTAPGLPQSRYEIELPLFQSFESGLRHGLKAHSDHYCAENQDALCSILNISRPMWLLSRFLDFDSTMDYNLLRDLWDLTCRHDRNLAGKACIKLWSTDYVCLYNELKVDDRTEEEAAEIESRYFLDGGRRVTGSELHYSHNNVWRRALAVKLTLVSQWNSRYHEEQIQKIRHKGNLFVADKKLWRWIGNCLGSI